ncbi:unnamed protein product, partial [Caretta caretta]
MTPLVGLEAPDAVRRLPGTRWAGQGAHEAELRFNTAPTAGYERDVGSKTTLRLLNSGGGGAVGGGAREGTVLMTSLRRLVQLCELLPSQRRTDRCPGGGLFAGRLPPAALREEPGAAQEPRLRRRRLPARPGHAARARHPELHRGPPGGV